MTGASFTLDEIERIRNISDEDFEKLKNMEAVKNSQNPNLRMQNDEDENKPKRDPYRIITTEPALFDASIDIMCTTTKVLCATINDYFVPAFQDYCGSLIVHQPVQGMVLSNLYLYFKVYPSDTYANNPDAHFAFNTVDIKQTNFINRLSAISTRVGGPNATVKITDDAKDVFSTLIRTRNGVKIKDAAWRDYFEIVQKPNETLVRVKNLDPSLMLRAIYGNKGEDGGEVEYEMNPIRPITNDGSQFNQGYANFVIHISRANVQAVSRAADNAGMVFYDGSIPMERASRE